MPKPRSPSSNSKPRYSEGGQALLDAAVRVFAAEGVGGLTYRAVAAEAGVTHGLVTYHFGSREALIHATLSRVAAKSVEQSAIHPDSRLLQHFLKELPTLTEETRGGSVAQFDLTVLACRDPRLGDEAREMYRQYIEATHEALTEFGIRPSDAMARLVFAAVDGLVLQQLLFDDPNATRQSLAALRELLKCLLPAEP